MDKEIKERIAAINSGIIPEGYKKTKVGIAPVEWKQVKLGEILKQRKTLMCVSEDAPLLSFTIEEGVIEPTDKKTNKRDFLIKDISTKKFALTEVGDIIYNPANLKFGAIHRNNLRKGVVSPIYGIFYGKQDSVFMGNLLHNQRFIDYAKIYTEGTVEKLKTLKAETFLKLKVVIPPLPEQQKIAEILSTQDKLIELQEKKIEQLKELKKAYLQKMFPKKGSKYPELRFKGFTDPWEQRKLSDMVERVTRKNENLESELPLTISAQYGLIDQNEFFDKRIASRDVSGYYLLKKGEFAYNKSTSSDAPWGAVKRLDRYEMGVLSTLYIVFALKEDGNIDSDFLVSYYDTDCWHKGVQAIAAEGARNHGLLNITPADYFETVLTVPSNVKEQHQIGTFFAKLDSLITLHQRKSEQEKQKKKALMQLLLTGIVRTK